MELNKKGFIVVFVMLFCALVLFAACEESNNNRTFSATPATTPIIISSPSLDTTESTQIAQSVQSTPGATKHYKVGDVANVGNIWSVTVNSVKASNGQNYSTPMSGNVYLLIDVSLKNVSNKARVVSSMAQFHLHDDAGQEYTEAITTFTKAPDGSAKADASLHGVFAYEVPQDMHNYTFSFSPDMQDSTEATWDLKD